MQGSHFLTYIILISFLHSGDVFGQNNRIDDPTSRPKIGLVLSGGGARGAAHLGVLKVLEENKIPIDVITGTSFGALVGGLYASGYSADDLTEILEDIDWQSVLSTEAPRNRRSFRRKQEDDGFLIKFRLGIKKGKLQLPRGLITPNNLRLLLRDIARSTASVHDFDNLPIPFRAVATDLETGNAVVLGKGDLAASMIASMAVPALFPPVELEGRLLVDGGVSNNTPIDVARSLGADIVIVVDISTPMANKTEISSFTSVINQLTLIMTNKNSAAQLATLKERDIVIRPDLTDVGFVDFDRTSEIVPKGEIAAHKVLAQMKSLSLSLAAWQKHIQARVPAVSQSPVIDFVRIKNNSKVSNKVIQARLSQKTGQTLDSQKLSEDLSEVYGIGLFEEVGYRVIDEGDTTGLEIRAKGREIGSSQIRFGLAMQDDFDGSSGFQMAAGFNNLAINPRGGELEAQFVIGDNFGLSTEFYQPIDFADRFYVFGNAKVNQFNVNVTPNDDSSELLSQVRVSEAKFQFGVGSNFGQWGSLRIGLERSFGKIRGRIGLPESVSVSSDATLLMARFDIDTLDNVRFPHAGITFNAEYTNGLSLMGGDSSVDSVLASAYAPYSWGKNTLGLLMIAGTSFNGEPDETNLFSLGGFMNLTAFAPGQLSGNHGGLVGAVYYRRFEGSLGYLTQTPLYWGATIETGNVWNDASNISLDDLKWSSSLFVGADTLIGPVYFGGGIGSKGEKAVFLYIGQLF